MKRYSEETRAAAMAALLEGQSVSSVAREYRVPKGTVSHWKRKAQEQAEVRPDRTQKEVIGRLLIEYLQASLRALAAQARVFSDPAWLQKQEASQLAVLHGVQTDKAVRLLEALAGSDGAGTA